MHLRQPIKIDSLIWFHSAVLCNSLFSLCVVVLYLEESQEIINIIIVYSNLPIPDSFVLGPQREVVSIYNNEFLTPLSRPQYFIEVYRCVKIDIDECPSFGPSGYPVPEEIEKIEIVVPDTTNKDRDSRGRDSSDKNTFYKYVVYYHTSCKCGTLKFRDGTLYKTITNNEG